MRFRASQPNIRPWSKIAENKRQWDMAKIPQEWLLPSSVLEEGKARRDITGDFIDGLLDPEARMITNFDARELIDSMSNGSLTVFQVIKAFCKRAACAHQLNRNLLEIGFDLAFARARELDEYFQKYQRPFGPLHGLPVALKDQFHIKGLGTTMGYVGWIDTFEGRKGTHLEKNFESELIRELCSVGAVPIGKTTLMVTTWAPETNNNILGYNWNPLNGRLSSGGSSGGQGALQALRGCSFGIGTDSGGSVSMPASFNGVYSLKPSSGRLSMLGAAGSGQGQLVIPAVPGIFGHSVDILRLVLKSVLSIEPWLHDPFIVPLPWRDNLDRNADDSLTFGMMKSDGIVAPHPPVARALKMVESAVQDAQYKVLQWDPPSHRESRMIHSTICHGDGSPDCYEAFMLSGESIPPEIDDVFPNGKLQPPISLIEFENRSLHLKDFRSRYHSYWMSTSVNTGNGRPVDAVILPVSPYAGLIPGKFLYPTYTSIMNVLDYPSVVIPVTFVDKEVDTIYTNYEPLNQEDKENMDTYDPELTDGAPAAVQIIGRHLDEERLLEAAQVVVEALEKSKTKPIH